MTTVAKSNDTDLGESPTPLFNLVDGWFHPTEFTTGPWRTDAMHGGPPSALIARCVENELGEGEIVARLGVDLEAPVSLVPLAVNVTRRQISRRVAKIDVVLRTAEKTLCTAQAVFLAGQELPAPVWTPDDGPVTVPGPEKTVNPMGAFHDGPVLYHRDSVEHRFVEGGFETPGPASTWISLSRPVVDNEEPSGLACLFAAADFGSAISQPLPQGQGLGLINVDVTVALNRHPVGPWIYLDSIGRMNPGGAGLAISQVGDLNGPVGVLTQAQLGYAS